jgi:hypothetical protein
MFKFNTEKPNETYPEESKEQFKENLKEILQKFGPFMRDFSGRNPQCSIHKVKDRIQGNEENNDICFTPLISHLFYPQHPVHLGESWNESWQLSDNGMKLSGSQTFTLKQLEQSNDKKTEIATILGVSKLVVNFVTDDIPCLELLLNSEFHVDVSTGVPIDWSASGKSEWVFPLLGRVVLNYEAQNKLI